MRRILFLLIAIAVVFGMPIYLDSYSRNIPFIDSAREFFKMPAITGFAVYSSCATPPFDVTEHSSMSADLKGCLDQVDDYVFSFSASSLNFNCGGNTVNSGSTTYGDDAFLISSRNSINLLRCKITDFSRGIAITGTSTNTLIVNASFSSGNTNDVVHSSSGTSYMRNSSFTYSKLSVTAGSLHLQNIVMVNVTDANHQPLTRAWINISDRSRLTRFSTHTGVSGINATNITYAIITGGAPQTVATYSKFNLSVNLSLYTRYNVTITNTSRKINVTLRALSGNDAPAIPTVYNPANGGKYNRKKRFDINFTGSDPNGNAITFYVYINKTRNVSASGISHNITQWNASDGYYGLNVSAKDSNNAFSANASTIWFTIDSTPPSLTGIQHNASTAKAAKRNSLLQFNVTIADAATELRYYVFSWNDTGVWVNTSRGSLSGASTKVIVNRTITAPKNRTIGFLFYANDTVNNTGASPMTAFTVKNTRPLTPVITMPVSGKNYTWTSINYTSSDADGDTITFFRYINKTFNRSSTKNVSRFNASDGFYNLTVYANDRTNSSANSTVIRFRIDTTGPSFSNAQDNKTGVKVNGAIQFNITITDQAGVNHWKFSWNGTGSWANSTYRLTTTIQSYKVSANASTNLTRGKTIGYYFWANDSLKNKAQNTIATFIVSNRAPNTTAIPAQSWSEDNVKTINISKYFQDLDNDDINWTYAKTGANIDVNLSNSSGQVNFTPAGNWHGTEYIKFTALDGYGGSNKSNNVTLTVSNTADCGDGSCESGEGCSTCERDCGSCGGGGGGGGGGGTAPTAPSTPTVPAAPEPPPQETEPPGSEPGAGAGDGINFMGNGASQAAIDSSIKSGKTESGYIKALINKTNQSIKYNRTVVFDNETNTTLVNITIAPKVTLYNFSYYELIPKCIALFLKEGLLNESDIEFKNWNFTILEEDPLIVWRFEEVRAPIDLSYTVKKKILEDCAKLLDGVGIATKFGPSLEKPKGVILSAKIIVPILAAIIAAAVVIYFSRFEIKERHKKLRKIRKGYKILVKNSMFVIRGRGKR